MRVEPRGSLRAQARISTSRALAGTTVLGLLVVVIAATTDPVRFTGPRWLPRSRPDLPPPLRSQRGGRPLPTHSGLPVWVLWVLAGLVAAGLVVWAVALLRGRWSERRWPSQRSRRPLVRASLNAAIADRPEAGAEPNLPAVQTAVELALQVLGEQREPADAVVRAWVGLQEAAGGSGVVRGTAETPTEFTSRVVRRVVADDRPVQTLLRLYLRTRFGDHPVTDDDVATVRDALQDLASSWPSPVGGRR